MEALYYIRIMTATLCCDWQVYLSFKLNLNHCNVGKCKQNWVVETEMVNKYYLDGCMCIFTHVGTSNHYTRMNDISPNSTCHPCISQCPSRATPVKKVGVTKPMTFGKGVFILRVCIKGCCSVKKNGRGGKKQHRLKLELSCPLTKTVKTQCTLVYCQGKSFDDAQCCYALRTAWIEKRNC